MDIIINKNKINDYHDKFITINNNNITFLKDGEYNIIIKNSTNIKLNITVEKNISIKLFIQGIDNKLNINNHYLLNKNSKLNISKFYSNESAKEKEIIDLNGERIKWKQQI